MIQIKESKPRKPRGKKPPVDRDKIIVRWIEEQQVVQEDADPPEASNIFEMPSSPEERKRRLEQKPKGK